MIETKRQKRVGVLFCLLRTWRGFYYYAQRWVELQQSKFLFVRGQFTTCNRLFYVPPSPVIGCHWSCVRGKRLHGSFLDFPGDFPPTAFWVNGALTDTPRSALKKKKLHSFHKRLISRYLRQWAAQDDQRSVSTFYTSDLLIDTAAPALHCFIDMVCRGKHLRIIMDYLPAIGKPSVW